MLLLIEVIAILILFVCLVYIRRSRKAPQDTLVLSDEEFCRRKVQEDIYFYGGSWQTGNQGRWNK